MFERLDNLLAGLLDRSYEQATRQTLRAVTSNLTSGVVAQRLDELDAEAARLAAAGQRLTPGNPVLRALLADLDPVLTRAANRADGAATDVQAAGQSAARDLTRQLAIGGIDDATLAALGITWNTPDPEAIAALVDYVSSDAFAAEVGRIAPRALDQVQNIATRGLVNGWGPLRIARAVRASVEGFTPAQINNLLRTLQLSSYRRATAAHQNANRDILTEIVRVAVLDQRTCFACIALHGERLPVGTVIQDHHQGRCTSVALVRGRPRNILTGPEWFDQLSPAQQQNLAAAQRSPGKLEALRAGRATLQDFVQPYTDDIFGQMIREGALRDAIR